MSDTGLTERIEMNDTGRERQHPVRRLLRELQFNRFSSERTTWVKGFVCRLLAFNGQNLGGNPLARGPGRCRLRLLHLGNGF